MLRVVHVKKETTLTQLQEENKEILMLYFDKDNVLYEEVITSTTIAETINAYAKEYKTNLVCLLNYEHSFIQKLTHEPIIKKISFHCNVPLLILPV